MSNNVVVPDRQSFETMEQVRLDATVQTILQQTNVNFKDNVATVADLPATGNEIGDFRMVLEDGWVYKWDGNGWINPSGNGILSVSVTLTPSQLLNLWNTPIEIIPAPGPGKMIIPINSIVEYSSVSGGTTDYSPLNGVLQIFYDRDRFFPQYVNPSGSMVQNMGFASLGQAAYMTPSANIYNGVNITHVYDPVDKAVKIWFVMNSASPYVPPSVGDRILTFRFNYIIKTLDFVPFYNTTTNPFTLKTTCNGGAFTPFDGTETNWSVTVLYNTGSLGFPLTQFTLNPVYEGAGVWNLGSSLIYGTTNLAQQGARAVQISCIKAGATITLFPRSVFPALSGVNVQFNGTYV